MGKSLNQIIAPVLIISSLAMPCYAGETQNKKEPQNQNYSQKAQKENLPQQNYRRNKEGSLDHLGERVKAVGDIKEEIDKQTSPFNIIFGIIFGSNYKNKDIKKDSKDTTKKGTEKNYSPITQKSSEKESVPIPPSPKYIEGSNSQLPSASRASK